jgi:hypothetical protein
MNFKTTSILFGIFTALLVTFAVALWRNPEKDLSLTVMREMHDKANPMTDGDVDRIEIDRTRPSAEKIVFVKDAQTKQWKITEPHTYRANSDVDTLVRQIYDAERDPEAGQLTDLKKAGLEPPAEVITLKKGDREVKLNVGDTSPGSANAVVYVTTSANPKEIMAVNKNRLADVFKSVNDFRSKDLLSPRSSDIQSVVLSEGKKGPIELKKVGEGDNWVYVRPPYGKAEYAGGGGAAVPGKAPNDVQALLTDLTRPRVENTSDFVADDVKDLAKYHLDKDVLKIEIDRTEEISTNEEGKKERKTSHHVLLVGVSRKVEKKKAEEKKGAEKKDKEQNPDAEQPDQYYAMLEGEGHVVKVSAQSVEPLRKLLDEPGALRDRNLVDTGGFKRPDAIDVKNGYGLLEFRRGTEPGKEWKLYRDKGETAHAVDSAAVEALVGLLTQKNVVTDFRDADQKKKLGLDNPDAPVVKVWLDGIAEDKDKKDKKDAKPKLKEPDKPSVELRFGNLDGSSVAVERKFADEKEGTIVLVPNRLLDQVREGPTAYLDRTLPPFAASGDAARDVTKVVVERGGTTTEVSREKPDAPWKIVKPEAQKDRTADSFAVENILRDLNGLRAEKLVTEKATEAKLGEYGLRPPETKVVITSTKEGKPQTFEYDFGKEAAGQNGVYAKQSQGDTVYVVAKAKLEMLGKELQDPKVFSFDPAKVRVLTLNGWYEKVRGSTEVVLKRTDTGSWTVDKTTQKLEIDSEKVRKFLDELSRLRAEHFVSHSKEKPATTEAQGLEVNKEKGALKVDVEVADEKEHFILTVGNLDGDKGYFAISNKLPGDVFDVRKDIFEEPKKAAGYFFK